MSAFEQLFPLISIIIAFATVLLTTLLLARQNRQLEHERNALALLAAIDRLTEPKVVKVFATLSGVDQRYPTDADIDNRFIGSEDEQALAMVGQYVETVACLARRRVLDASLLVDAVGWMLRSRWTSIEPFVKRWRAYNGNPYLFENFQWLARYSEWWKDLPRPRDPNYSPTQFETAVTPRPSPQSPVTKMR
ncbi:MAG: hypothetical protein GIW99_02010 [Candidatus Eremiobacteraeota bacterium]|nr:hypothetical protein [Candidatus Eremiobacteraeota bacterium]MBC5826451.1 hypothetical protein [Candidatus Eremiobacteraeota bacterium]